MNDPSWIPSAIMQTVGALYAIFITCFVLVLQNANKYQNIVTFNEKSGKTFNEKLDKFNTLFKILTIVVVFTELYNGLSLYYISQSDFSKFPDLLFVSYFTFAFSVFYIAGFSQILIAFMIKSRKGSDQSTSNEHLSRNRLNFTLIITLIFYVSIFFALFILKGVNTNTLGAFVSTGFLLIVVWAYLDRNLP